MFSGQKKPTIALPIPSKLLGYTPLLLILILLFSYVFAFPPLESYQQNNFNFNAPVGWQVNIDEQQGLISLQENPNDPLAADIFALTMYNEQYLSPYQANEQMVLNMGLNDIILLDQQDVENGSLLVVAATLEKIPVKIAVLSFVDLINNRLSIAVFSATAESFDALGGAPLLFVTIAGEDPMLYENTDIIVSANQTTTNNQNIAFDAWCFEESGVVYSADYCVYQRAIQNRTVVSPELLSGEWSYALSVPSGDVWESPLESRLSFGASGTGMAMFFHPDGRYDLIYNWSSTANFCTNSVKAAESGKFAFDGTSLQLQDARFKAELSTCSATPNILEDFVTPSILEIAFINANQVSLVLSCENHPYMISCNDNQSRYFVLERSN